MENMYCRLCAEPKNSDGVLNLDGDEKQCDEILFKLSFLNAMYVDVTTPDNLPKNVCFTCLDSLNKAYDFLEKVRKAQEILNTLFPPNDAPKYDLSDDDRAALDDFFLDNNDLTEIKQESPSPVKQKKDLLSEAQVKIEPKEEEPESTNTVQEAIPSTQSNTKTSSTDQINAHKLVDSTLKKAVTEINKKCKSWKDFSWACSICDIEFMNVDILRSHSKTSHNKCAAFTCVDCKAFVKNDNFSAFLKHIRKHRKGLRNRCHYCDEAVDPDTLGTHIKQHFLKDSVPCPSCGDILENEELLHQHIRDYKHVKQKRKPRRKAGTPITVEDLTCHICKKVYKNPNSLRDHLKRHTSDRKRNYTCDRCGKTFLSKGTLTSHVMAHDEIRPHACRICNKSFLFPNMLRRHVEMHSGIKPYSCEICGRCFRLQYQLNAHKIVHTDSMPHVCSYCNKAFRFKQILKNHERQHTGAKPYSCQHCFMEFSNWSNYNKHMKRRHNTDTSKKKITPEGVFPINPETGQIMQVDIQGMEEWKSKVMIPAKRGKKKVIKEENIST